MTSNGERKISSLRDLPLDIAPSRDLWQAIEARIAAALTLTGIDPPVLNETDPSRH
jgi:hypothetical protein